MSAGRIARTDFTESTDATSASREALTPGIGALAPNPDALPAPEGEVHAEMAWLCGVSEYWVYWVDGLGIGHIETRYQLTYCDSGGGGGVGGCSVNGLEPSAMSGRPASAFAICNGDGSGGEPGGGNGSNNQIANPTLHAAVDDGKGNATAKLQSAQCQAMIRMNKNAAGISLWTVLTSYSPEPGTYLDSQITFVKGDGTFDIASNLVPCNYGRLAWTSVPGVHTVDICGSSQTLSTGMRGVTLIHEMLHTLGLPEYPNDPNAYTTEDIQQMVVDWCGGQ